jgi:monothiol glutaredoxin
MGMDTKAKIFEQVTNNPIVLYMKGTPQFPQCGFSAMAVEILRRCGVTQMLTVDVLMDPEIRQGVKQYANWPTVPQLYLSGEFVGGADILREMFDSGELQEQIKPLLPANDAGA